MTKLEMAHELLITLIQAGEHSNCSGSAVKYVWEVIDAMQAEAEKREQEASEKSSKEIIDILENHEHTFVDGRICWCGKIK